MRDYVHVLVRLVSCWGMVPPEVVAAGLFAAPGITGFLAGLPYGLGLLADAFVFWWCTEMLKEHLWPDVPSEHRRFVFGLRNRVLLLPPDRDHSPRGDPGDDAERIARAAIDMRWTGADRHKDPRA